MNINEEKSKNLNINTRGLSIKERAQIFNNRSIHPASAKNEGNVKKLAPKKLAINPNLLGQDGSIKIMSNSKKIITEQNKEKVKNSEQNLQTYLYGNKNEGKEVNNKSMVDKRKKDKSKKEENDKKEVNNSFLSSNYAKKKNEKNTTSLSNILKSLINPKSKYEQEVKENKKGKAPVKIPNKLIAGKFKNVNENKNPTLSNKNTLTNKSSMESSQEKNNDNKENEENEENKEIIEVDDKEVYEIKKSKTDINKNRNLSTGTRKLKNLKEKYDISNTLIPNPLNELNKKKKEYYRKEYCNLESINYSQYIDKYI